MGIANYKQNLFKEDPGKKPFIPLWPGSNPDDYERSHQVLVFQPSQRQYAVLLSVNVGCVPSAVIYVLSSQIRESKSLRVRN